MEDRLAAAGTDVDEHAIVLEPGAASDLRDEVEHPLRLVRGELGDVAERVDVPLREDEQVRLRLRIEVADRDEAVINAIWQAEWRITLALDAAGLAPLTPQQVDMRPAVRRSEPVS